MNLASSAQQPITQQLQQDGVFRVRRNAGLKSSAVSCGEARIKVLNPARVPMDLVRYVSDRFGRHVAAVAHVHDGRGQRRERRGFAFQVR